MSKIIVEITTGPLSGQVYTFDRKIECSIGRSEDCTITLPNDEAHKAVSRTHCVLEIKPPSIKIRDSGSFNGTFVNDTRIGKRKPSQTRHDTVLPGNVQPQSFQLEDGDHVKVGLTTLKIHIEKPAYTPVKINSQVDADQSLSLTELQDLLVRAQKGEKALAAFADYKVLRELGSGIHGTAFLANHLKTGKNTTLRLIKPMREISGQALESGLSALQSAVALEHENIAKINQFCYVDGLFLIASEYCYGGSLYSLLQRRGGKLPLTEILPIVLQVLEGLQYAHQCELATFQPGADPKFFVHYELHPKTILLDNTDTGQFKAKITGYGLKYAFDIAGVSSQMRSHSNAELAPYVPKQRVVEFNYQKPDADIWAVAAILYQALTGVTPRDLATEADPWRAVMLKPVIPIRKRCPDFSSQAAIIIDQALNDKTALYYQQAADFIRVLKRLV